MLTLAISGVIEHVQLNKAYIWLIKAGIGKNEWVRNDLVMKQINNETIKSAFVSKGSGGWIQCLQVSRTATSNYIPLVLCEVITCPCPWYLIMAHKSSIGVCHSCIRIFSIVQLWYSKIPWGVHHYWIEVASVWGHSKVVSKVYCH